MRFADIKIPRRLPLLPLFVAAVALTAVEAAGQGVLSVCDYAPPESRLSDLSLPLFYSSYESDI